MPVWVFAVVLVRDLLVNGLRRFAAKNHIVLEASLLGKFKTTFQMVALGVILFGLIVNIGLVTTIGNILLYISLIMDGCDWETVKKEDILSLIDVVVASRIVPQIDGFDYMKLNTFYSSISEKPEYSAFKKSKGAIYKFIR